MSTRYPLDPDDALSMADGTPWYMSPDVWLDTAVANVGPNTVNLRAHLAPGTDFKNISQAEIELFVGFPSLLMSPTVGTIRIGTTLVAKSDLQGSPTGSVTTSIPWNVPAADPANPNSPDQPGHRCLVARVYPFGSQPPGDFQVVADQHEAQRNICVALCAEEGAVAGGAGGGLGGDVEHPMGKGEDGLWTFAVDTTVVGQAAETVEITARIVERFLPEEEKQVLPLLKPTGFARLADSPPPTTKLEFLTRERVLDSRTPKPWPEWFPRRFLPIPPLWTFIDRIIRPRRPQAANLTVELEPGRTARLAVRVDLGATAVREAQALKVEQFSKSGDPQGGILLIFLRVA